MKKVLSTLLIVATLAGAIFCIPCHATEPEKTQTTEAIALEEAQDIKTEEIQKELDKSRIRKIVDCFCAATGAKNQGVMQTDTMSGINWSSIPVSIVEMGYMTNRTEDLNMASTSYQTKMVQGIANGIDAYYGA